MCELSVNVLSFLLSKAKISSLQLDITRVNRTWCDKG